MERLGLRARTPRPRSSRATGTRCCSRGSRSPAPASSASRPRSATSSAPRCARSRSHSAPGRRAHRRCRTSATRSLTERITGLARVLRGYAQTGLENVALWHERDISHSGAERVVLPDATIAARLRAAPRDHAVAEGMTVHAERMRENIELTHGALFSQRALTALVESGIERDEAYRLVQESAQRAWDEGTRFRELIAEGGAGARPRRGLRLRRLPRARARGDRPAGRAR